MLREDKFRSVEHFNTYTEEMKEKGIVIKPISVVRIEPEPVFKTEGKLRIFYTETVL